MRVNVPLYFPKNSSTRASFGSSSRNPPQNINPVINSITANIIAAGTASIPPHIAIAIEPNNNTNVTNSIKKPFNVVPSKAYSFFNSFVAIILYFYKMFFLVRRMTVTVYYKKREIMHIDF